MELRYTGSNPTTFLAPPVGSLDPGDTFHVNDLDHARAFLTLPHVELVNEKDAALLAVKDDKDQEGATEDTEDRPRAESPATPDEVAGDPTERQDDPTPAPRRSRKTASSGSADTTTTR